MKPENSNEMSSSEAETPTKKPKSSISDDEETELPSFSPATLGLHRVGTALPPKPPPQPVQILNARGMPARIRKRNRLFFDDDIINDSKSLRASLSPRKSSKPNSPAKTPTKVLKKRHGVVSRYMKPEIKEEIKEKTTVRKTPVEDNKLSIDREMHHLIGVRLRNLLKLPKAHKFVIFEWFYSFVDKPLFDGENEFQICLRESFPQLKTRNLTRAEWQKIRAMIGKPRRCSAAFFEEERRELELKRQKIRLLQTRKSCDLDFIKDLPDKIPMVLPVATTVTARLRYPQDGLFTARVDAYDSLTSTYRLTFERAGLGTHTIPDFEIVSDSFNEMLPLASVTQEAQQRFPFTITNSPLKSRGVLNRSDPLLGQEVFDTPFKNPVIEKSTIGGFPVKLLENVVRLKKTLSIKSNKLQRLTDMNAEAELKKSYNGELPEDFQRRYASIVLSMEKMNRDIHEYLVQIQTFTPDLTRDPQVQAMLTPSYLREKCREAADLAVARNNNDTVKDKHILTLIKDLATVLLVSSHLSNETNTDVVKVLEGCIEEVKSRLLDSDNTKVFQKQVQIHLHHIRLGIGAMTNRNNSTAAGGNN